MIGQSSALRTAVSRLERIARCDAPVMIEGETGTGKELAARAIHYGSARRVRPFIPVNCGAIPDALIENELFGHRPGAYTDARAEHTGLIAHAQHGTLFLDEVDALTPRAQVTLLRFLQDQQYRPLGGGAACSADVRVIAATNADVGKLTDQGLFRLDLLFRLKIMELFLPPLRERRGDVALLAGHFLGVCAGRFGQGDKRLHADTLAWMEDYHWPGNVRELENLVQREYLMADGAVIRIPPPPVRGEAVSRPGASGAWLDFKAAKSRAIAEFERRYLNDVLAAVHGNVTRAAHLVGKERRAFGKLLKKHGIDRFQYSPQAPREA
jgi:two-component system, NtrC family, response regulator GlrR